MYVHFSVKTHPFSINEFWFFGDTHFTKSPFIHYQYGENRVTVNRGLWRCSTSECSNAALQVKSTVPKCFPVGTNSDKWGKRLAGVYWRLQHKLVTTKYYKQKTWKLIKNINPCCWGMYCPIENWQTYVVHLLIEKNKSRHILGIQPPSD